MGFSINSGCLRRSGSHRVEWVHARRASGRSKGIIFAPPLIGAGFSREVSTLRRLVRSGYELFSFNYSGHGQSSDRFRLKATLADTTYALDFLIHRFQNRPIFAVGACYSAIPLFYAAHQYDEPFAGITLINAVCRISPAAIAASFLSYYRSAFPRPFRIKDLGRAFQRYADFLFPGIEKNRHVFGTLLRRRTDLFGTAWDLLFFDPLTGIAMQKSPVLCLYAKHDRILKIYDNAVGTDYERQVLQICPHAAFYPLTCDHFLSCPKSRDQAFDKIMDFFNDPGAIAPDLPA